MSAACSSGRNLTNRKGCRQTPPWRAASAVTSATTVGWTLVNVTRSRPPNRFEATVSGHGWSADAGVRTVARERDCAAVSGTLRPAMTSSPLR